MRRSLRSSHLLLAALLALAAGRAAALTETECLDAWDSALAAGNCSSSACDTSCLSSLAEVPVGCTNAVATRFYNDTVLTGETLDEVESILASCGYRVFVNSTSERITQGVSFMTMIEYLVGICLGAVIMSIIFIILLVAPALLSKALDSPMVLVHKGKKAVKRGGKYAAGQAKKGMAKAEREMGEMKGKMGGKSKAAVAVAADDVKGSDGADGPAAPPTTAALAAMEAAEEAPPATPATPLPAAPAADDSDSDSEESGPAAHAAMHSPSPMRPSRHLHLTETSASGQVQTAMVTWMLLALVLYIAALILMILGMIDFVNNTVAAEALQTSGNVSLLTAIEWLIIGSLIIVGVCDFFTAWIVTAANDPFWEIRGRQIKNYLFSKWVNRHAYRIQVCIAGVVTLVLTLAMVLFGLGILVVTIQLITQLACSQLENLSIKGVTVSQVCVEYPGATEGAVCGYDALTICYEVQGMGVLTLVLGAALLLWSHIIWLVLLLLSMYKYRQWFVKVSDGDSSGAPSSASSMAALADAGGEGGEGGEGDAAVVAGGAAARERPSLLRRVKFWDKGTDAAA